MESQSSNCKTNPREGQRKSWVFTGENWIFLEFDGKSKISSRNFPTAIIPDQVSLPPSVRVRTQIYKYIHRCMHAETCTETYSTYTEMLRELRAEKIENFWRWEYKSSADNVWRNTLVMPRFVAQDLKHGQWQKKSFYTTDLTFKLYSFFRR